MAIVKMKKLRLFAVRSQREAILRELMLMGCVEINEPELTGEETTVPLTHLDGSELFRTRGQYNSLAGAIKVLDKYAPEKKKLLAPLPEAELQTLLDESELQKRLGLAGEISGLDEQIRRIASEESRERALIESLRPWESLDLSLDFKGTDRTLVLEGTLPAQQELAHAQAAMLAETECAELIPVSEDESMHYVLLICLREDGERALSAIRPLGFSIMNLSETHGTAREGMARGEERLEELAGNREALTGRLTELAGRRGELKLCADMVSTKIARAEASGRLLCTDSSFVFEGWITAEGEALLDEKLAAFDCAWETEDPDPARPEEVPVKLRSNTVTRPYNMITEMYSLPSYNGLDPNPFVMPFFALFFGIMFADMAYGFIMLLAGIVILKKAKPRGGMKSLAGLMVQCGISTFIIGFFTGGFFGDAVSVVGGIFGKEWTLVPTFGALHFGSIVIDLPLNLLEGNNPLYVLIAAMVLGVIHLALGVGLGVFLKIRDGQWLDAVLNDLSWWVMFAGVAVMIINGSKIVLIVGIAMMVLGGILGGKGFGRITGVFSAVYNGVTGYLGDILSYSRLMALMLAGSVIASVFNQLGALGGIVLFIPVFLIGHALNFGLNVIGCFVHTMRLQFLEFFGKWYRDGGRPFRPLTVNTKYVAIKEEKSNG